MADTQMEPGCGWTTRDIVAMLITRSNDQYLEELAKLPRLSGRSRNDLAAGFRDGVRAAIHHLEGMGVLTVYPSPSQAQQHPSDDEATS